MFQESKLPSSLRKCRAVLPKPLHRPGNPKTKATSKIGRNPEIYEYSRGLNNKNRVLGYIIYYIYNKEPPKIVQVII